MGTDWSDRSAWRGFLSHWPALASAQSAIAGAVKGYVWRLAAWRDG
jgi:hypothetical protein